jgi:hypothetical protein
MRAEVRSIDANDIPTWPDWQPSHPLDEYQWFTVSVGVIGSSGSSLFQVVVGTAIGIRERRHKQEFVGLVVERMEPTIIEHAIRAFVASGEAPLWELLVEQLRVNMHWEFTGYRA